MSAKTVVIRGVTGSEGFTSNSLMWLLAGGFPSLCGPLPRAPHHMASPRASGLKERGPVPKMEAVVFFMT